MLTKTENCFYGKVQLAFYSFIFFLKGRQLNSNKMNEKMHLVASRKYDDRVPKSDKK